MSKLEISIKFKGGNEEAARLCGVKVNKVIVKVYALAGLLTALAGIILSSRLAS
ncbi:ABC transporter permease subunit, partial [Clostridioides difficile]